MLHPKRLVDPIGYDSIDLREEIRESGGFEESPLVVNELCLHWLFNKSMEAAETNQVCQTCGDPLMPFSSDPNHHSSMTRWPVEHYCAEHCPACAKRESGGDDPQEFLRWLAQTFGGIKYTIVPPDDEADTPLEGDDDELDDNNGNDGFVWS